MATTRGRGTNLPRSWLEWQAAQDPLDTQLRLTGFRAVLGGRSVGAPELAREVGCPVGEVRERLRQMNAGGLLEFDDREQVIGCWGLTTRPTGHALWVNGRHLYTWCAVDALGIPAALEADARVESRCAGCGGPIRVNLARGVPSATPDGVRVWVADVVPGRAMAGDT